MKHVKVDILVLAVAFIVAIGGLMQLFHDEAYACIHPCNQPRCECRWRSEIFEQEWNGEPYCYSTLPLVGCEITSQCTPIPCSQYCTMWGDSLSCIGEGPT